MAIFLPFSVPEHSSAAAGLTGVSQWAVELMEGIGAPGAGLIVALENLFPPLPSEIILPLAGFTAAGGASAWSRRCYGPPSAQCSEHGCSMG
jgi:hypothetical protein